MVYGHIIIAKMRKNTNLHPDGRKPASGLRFSQSSYSRVTLQFLRYRKVVHLVVPHVLIPARLTGKSHRGLGHPVFRVGELAKPAGPVGVSRG